MKAYLEHLNIHVTQLDAIAEFISTAIPAFKVRFDSGTSCDERWLHIGDEQHYFALYQATEAANARKNYGNTPGLNHVGIVVEEAVENLRKRLLKAGYTETTIENFHPARKRIYFADPDGNDWEFIQYLHADPVLRNNYDDAKTN
ncbi:VOC family protein [Teredinibacter turnerae]|uniref:VOC family protein n=1 Tax=Teredinibacter turnerae TaxID=2426 RepID=UPI00036C26CF|nr:VOC family protein [Teredinibacter turnerae]